MKKILSNKKMCSFSSLIVALCLLSTSTMVFAGAFKFTDDGHSSITFEVNNKKITRYYGIYVPPKTDASPPPEGVPLMVDVHGLSGSPKAQARLTRWDEVANGETGNNRFVIVYPEGTFGEDKIKCFNAGDGLDGTYDGCCWTAHDNKTEDVQFIKALVEKIKGIKEYNIDPQRIYGSGLSNGSALIQKVLVEEPGVFTAAYVASQTLLQFPAGFPNNDYHFSVPIMLSHGVYDEKVHYKGEESLYDLDEDGVKETAFHFPSAIDNAKRWGDINNCGRSTDARMTKDGHLKSGATKDWVDCDNGVIVRLRAVYGGHVHYSGTLINEAWEFLKQWTKE